MNSNNEKNSFKSKLRLLEEKLHSLPQAKVPQTFKARLFETIPKHTTKTTPRTQILWHPRAKDLTAIAAAVILIFALTSMLNFALPTNAKSVFADFEDISLCYPTWDQNAVSAENILKAGLSSSIINQVGT